jgi:hypothetical protein
MCNSGSGLHKDTTTVGDKNFSAEGQDKTWLHTHDALIAGDQRRADETLHT